MFTVAVLIATNYSNLQVIAMAGDPDDLGNLLEAGSELESLILKGVWAVESSHTTNKTNK